MALSNSQYDSIMRLYNRTQLSQKHALDQRTAEIYERIPAIREMNEEIASSAVKGARQLLDGDTTATERLKRTIEGLREERQVLLAAYGYPKDYLEMRYDCPDCKDTGYRDGKKCHCFRQREIDLLYSQSNIKEIVRKISAVFPTIFSMIPGLTAAAARQPGSTCARSCRFAGSMWTALTAKREISFLPERRALERPF